MNLLVFNEIVLNQDLKQCFIEEVPIKLTRAEYLLLEFLIQNKNKIFSRRELLNVWTREVSLRTVDTTVSRLRKKLGKYSRYLETRIGFGYGIKD